MRADNTHHILAAAQQRAHTTRRRALAALRRMKDTGTPITFDAVAREARVSRSWLYTQPDLRADIENLRNIKHPNTNPIPARQRSTDDSIRHRLELATHRIRQLETDNTRLRQALAEALGERRTITNRRPTTTRPEKNFPDHRTSPPASSATPSTSQTRSSQP